MYLFLIILMSYLIGSIPNALVIGKVFYKKDVRQYGSGNLGGSNAGRVLGKKVGFLVIMLDGFKPVLTITLTRIIIGYTNPDLLNLSIYLSAIITIIGHCFPCFASFKGGKAVASTFGVLLITNVYIFIISLIVFMIALKLSKMVSLSSITSICFSALLTLIPLFRYSPLLQVQLDLFYTLVIFLVACFVTYRHKSNLKRIKEGKENKITWMK